jgi:hypothetical protein
MTQVTHIKFGTGTIVSQDENNVTVDFNGSVKTFVIKYANLINVDGSVFGDMAIIVKKSKKSGSVKRMNYEATLTETQKKALRFENADGSTNWDAKNKWIEEREAIKRGSHSSYN